MMSESGIREVDAARARWDAHMVCCCKANQARLAVMSATLRPMPSATALAMCELMNVLIVSDALYCQALALACRLRETRERGNTVDFWRAVGEIERFARERGA